MRRKTTPPPEPQKPNLTMPRTKAKELIRNQIQKLVDLTSSNIGIEKAKEVLEQLGKYNKELLGRMFDNNAIEKDYNRALLRGLTIRSTGNTRWADARFGNRTVVSEGEKFAQEVRAHINELESIVERLELIPELAEISNFQESMSPKREFGSEVFIVHGSDNNVKDTVARFIESLGLKVVILHEKPNAGKTLIEKFEKFSNVGFAIILMTPDDVGSLASERKNLQPRARQNVIFELGYFIGKIGRERVCALYAKGVELPSDYEGVAFIPMEGEWRLLVAREMKAAGIDIDMNKAVE